MAIMIYGTLLSKFTKLSSTKLEKNQILKLFIIYDATQSIKVKAISLGKLNG